MEQPQDLRSLGMGRDLVHGTATHCQMVCVAEAAHFLEHPGDIRERHSLIGASHGPAMLAGGRTAHDLDEDAIPSCVYRLSFEKG